MIFAPIIAAATLVLGAPPPSDTYISLMRERLVAESPLIRAIGINPRDYIFRLDYLSGKLASIGDTAPSAQRDDLVRQAQLEMKLDAELLVNLCPYFSAVAGLDESWYNADPKVPPDPVAFYVPPPQKTPYALVVLLHGRAQTETDLVSHELFRRLAERYHAILVAPWGTGNALWGDAPAAEIARILDEMQQDFPIDPSRIYLVGTGMGGDGSFHVAARYPGRFRALLTIGGGISTADAYAIATVFRQRNVYVVSDDDMLGNVLAADCVTVSRYTTHRPAADPYGSAEAIESAWDDMFDGIVRNGSTRECSD